MTLYEVFLEAKGNESVSQKRETLDSHIANGQLAHGSCSAIAGSPLQCWDNSTRGLDSATALECVRTLRTSADLTGATAVVTLYQASQSIYEVALKKPRLKFLANS